jgi:hypothetical protein
MKCDPNSVKKLPYKEKCVLGDDGQVLAKETKAKFGCITPSDPNLASRKRTNTKQSRQDRGFAGTCCV